MKTLFLFILIIGTVLGISAQDITISFQPKVSGTTIDSIWVTNLKTNQKVKLLGNESLILTKSTGIDFAPTSSESGYLYPNPCYGDAIVGFSISRNQNIELRVYNISGQLLGLIKRNLNPGLHRFQIQFPVIGIYNVTVLKDDGFLSFKAICTGVKIQECKIKYAGSENSERLKNALVEKRLNYSPGENLYYSSYSGKNNTIITDSPSISKFYSVEFHDCIDPDKNYYSTVKIGDQWWMAENLKTTKYSDGTTILYVPELTAWTTQTNGAYCWYNNDLSNKTKYGALYNWYAVNDSKLCPTGWHVASSADWNGLINFLSDNNFGYNGIKVAIAKSMAAKTNWIDSPQVGSPGNDPSINNSSGFTALPGGIRSREGNFLYIGYASWWWCADFNSETTNSRYINNSNLGIAYVSSAPSSDTQKVEGFSVRCIKD